MSDPSNTSIRRNLVLLWAGQFVSAVGDAALYAALLFLVLALEPVRGATKSGVVALAETLPYLLFGLVAGAVVDRSRRVRLMIGADLGRAAVLLLIPLLFWMGGLNWASLAMVAFLVGSLGSLFNPARDALLPDVGPGVDLVRVNSIFQTSVQAALVVGTGLSAAFLHWIRSAESGVEGRLVTLLGLDGLTFVVSALFLAALRLPGRVRAPQKQGAGGALRDAWEGLRDVIRDPLIRSLLIITALDNLFIMGPATVGATLLIRRGLGLGPASLALFECSFSVAFLLATLALLRWGPRIPKGKMVILGILLDGLTYIPFFWVRSFPVLLAAIFVHALAVPLIVVGRSAIIQQVVPRERLGKVFSLMNLTVYGFWSLSGLITGWAGDALTAVVPADQAPRLLFLLAGIGGTLCGLLAFRFRSLRVHR